MLAAAAEGMFMSRIDILTVSQLNRYVRSVLESDRLLARFFCVGKFPT